MPIGVSSIRLPHVLLAIVVFVCQLIRSSKSLAPKKAGSGRVFPGPAVSFASGQPRSGAVSTCVMVQSPVSSIRLPHVLLAIVFVVFQHSPSSQSFAPKKAGSGSVFPSPAVSFASGQPPSGAVSTCVMYGQVTCQFDSSSPCAACYCCVRMPTHSELGESCAKKSRVRESVPRPGFVVS